MKRTIKTDLIALLLLPALFCLSQEGLKPLSSNINYRYGDINPALYSMPAQQAQAKSPSGTLFLPFKEDFSYAYKNNYPATDKWMDSTVFVNTGFGIAPISIGVATFDGLDKHGYPYTPNNVNLQISSKADTLTSRPINLGTTAASQTLLPTDKVALSFYYQAGGNGDYPENTDSLVLDFYNPILKKWLPGQWTKTGPTTPNYNDTLFKRVFLWIKDPTLLQDSFQFRFRSYATTAGDFDHWNLDYIYLDMNRDSIADTSYYDIAFAGIPTPVLRDYSAMPHKQYMPFEMATRCSVRIRNNYSQAVPFSYNYQMPLDANNFSNIHSYGDFDNLSPFRTAGYCSYASISNPKCDSAFHAVDRNFDFQIKHNISLTGGAGSNPQFFTGNDSIIQYQRFRNYYAFDDGSAEAGYYILGTGGKMAVKINLNQADTLVGAAIYFDHVGEITTKETFKLNVWAAGVNGPGPLIITDTGTVSYRKDGLREIPQYPFTTPLAGRILSPGTYYIGFQQLVQTGISVGFDRNFDHRTSLYYDAGPGWTQSQIYGSVMIRPIFGSFNGTPIGIKENSISRLNVTVFPNPASDVINIERENEGPATIRIFNALGEKVKEVQLRDSRISINTSELGNGVYLLTVSNGTSAAHRQKIIISR